MKHRTMCELPAGLECTNTKASGQALLEVCPNPCLRLAWSA